MKGSGRKRGKQGRYYVTVDLDRGPDGRRRQVYKSGFKTKKEADAWLADVISRQAKGEAVEASRMTTGEYLDQWFAVAKQSLRATTQERYEAVIRVHLKPTIGHVPVQKLTTHHLDQVYASRTSAGGTVRFIHAVVSRALKDGVRKGVLTRNVALGATLPRLEKRGGLKCWTRSEVQRFLSHVAADDLYPAYVLALTTGMRRGEVFAITWRDLDLDACTVTVGGALTYADRHWAVREPKSNAGYRTIPIDSWTRDALVRQREVVESYRAALGDAYEDNDLVFPRPTGKHRDPDLVSEHFVRSIKAAGLPKITFHGLRHTHATLLLMDGAHVKAVSERLGHSDVTVTLGTYAHVLPGLQETVAERFGASIFAE